MLVLLIIFMVTAPLVTQGVKVDLPKDATSESKGIIIGATVFMNSLFYEGGDEWNWTSVLRYDVFMLFVMDVQVKCDMFWFDWFCKRIVIVFLIVRCRAM